MLYSYKQQAARDMEVTMRKSNRILWVFKYLWEQTDDEHPATIADITAYLETQGLIVKDYRVIQADIADLTAMGIDIIEDRSRKYKYSVGTRHFEVPEVKLLVDAVVPTPIREF